jgi:pyrroloquinoline-quinone synthase
MTDSFTAIFDDLHLLKTPFYQAWMAGDLSREELKDYAQQYYRHVACFPRYLGAIHSNCEDEAQRHEILENLNAEEGVGYDASHPELWMQFAEGVGNTREEVKSALPRAAIQNVVDTFFKHARSSYHEGLGALYVYEAQVPEIAHSKIEGLKKNYDITDSKTLKFFEVHETADVHHRAVIEKLLNNLPEDKKREAVSAGREAAQALWNFLADVRKDMCAAA